MSSNYPPATDGTIASPPSLSSAASASANVPGGANTPSAPKKSRKSREPKPAKRPSSCLASPSDGSGTSAEVKPLHRPVMVCRRCRTKKIKCDLGFPSCGPCIKANESCVGLDPATGREVSRSYISELEDQVAQLRKELETARHGNDAKNSHGSIAPADAFPIAPWQPDAPTKRQTVDGTDLFSRRPSKRQALGIEHKSHALDSLETHGLALGPNAGEQTSSAALRPSLRQINSYASGLSPARLLCQAIQQSASAGLRSRDSRSVSNKKLADDRKRRVIEARQTATSLYSNDAAATKPAGEVKRETLGARELGQRPDEPKQSASRSASPSRHSSTPSETTKKNSPFDDADPMQYAETTETSDITVPAPEQLSKPSPLPAPFPPIPVARKLVDAYFQRVNPQWPLLDRDSFMPRFESACREGLTRAKAKLEAQARKEGRQLAEFNEDEVEIELQPADGHLFHLVLAIAAAMGWVRASSSAERHHEAAMRYLDPRRASSGSLGVGAIMGRDSLEQLQCLLLTALYSMMRTMKPGIWYCLGVALRLTTGLGLYSESAGLLGNVEGGGRDATESLVEKKRRLFWCAYSIDRSVGVHLGRPFGIADTDIKVNLPWIDQTDATLHEGPVPSTLQREEEEQHDESMSTGGFDERESDTSTERLKKEAASTLALLGESRRNSPASATVVGDPLAFKRTSLLPRPKDPSRWVSLSFFRMRILQSEIQGLLFSNAELPRRFASFERWKIDMLDRLAAWREYAPSSKEELEKAGSGYNPIFLELNFRQTLLMIYGMSPRFPTPTRSDLAHVEDCSKVILDIYAVLAKEGQMNYTWMTGHNIFIACTSYLYAIWQISANYPQSLHSSMSRDFPTKTAEIQHYGRACDDVLASLQWFTAEKCRKCLRTMFSATTGVVEKLDKLIAASQAGSNVSGAAREHRQNYQQHGHSSSVNAQKEKWWDSARETVPGWDTTRTSDVRSGLPALLPSASPGISARSLYSQEPSSRLSMAVHTPRGHHTGLPPVPSWPSSTAPDHASGSSSGLSRGAPAGGHAVGSYSTPSSRAPPSHSPGRSRSDSRSSIYMPPEAASVSRNPYSAGLAKQDARLSWKASSPRFTQTEGPSRHLTFAPSYLSDSPSEMYTPSNDAHVIGPALYQSSPYSNPPYPPPQSGNTPSNGLELETIAGAQSSPGALFRNALGTSPGGVSLHSPTGDSPTQIDLSSMMATSAMELDQLFREAGLSINFEAGGGLGGTLGGPTDAQGSSNGSCLGSFVGAGPQASAGVDNLGMMTGGAGVVGEALDSAGSAIGTRDPNLVALLGGPAPASSDDGYENDWEALGFGFRMSQTAFDQRGSAAEPSSFT